MVSIICCTMRNSFMENIFSNYERQSVKKKEMIIVLNRDNMDLKKWKRKAKEYKNIRVYQVSENEKLGKCLNYGIKKAKYDIIAKFDDDDYYAPDYLTESVDTIKKLKVPVVGKHTSYIYFEGKKALMLFREGGEYRHRSKVKGGTLVFKREVWDKVQFDEDQQNGSDSDFLRRCKRNGFKIYSVSKHNYVCFRRENIKSHTQKTSTEEYMARCKLIERTRNYIPIITKSFS
ncbi:glycosyltransferase [Paenibacillus abyssi]|uniref:Glycosyl transferase n=1 Tax=Paenibacillus abyssi TaxID=1340531 RepID=A0A917CW76_9BACL|nr:glycosyltransferase [Paenibacillus abyssi]GGF98737.1 glycosyl transferase [Paenibacillus abyssi]